MALTGRQEMAAGLMAAGLLTGEDIATRVGVTRKTLYNWLDLPAFKDRVEAIKAEIRANATLTGIALVGNRVAALNDRWERMKQVVTERADDTTHQHVPGFKTGLLAHNVKGVGRGEDFQLVDVYEVDTGLLRELREHERQAAQELGQWMEKQEVTQRGSVTIRTITAVQPALAPPSDDDGR